MPGLVISVLVLLQLCGLSSLTVPTTWLVRQAATDPIVTSESYKPMATPSGSAPNVSLTATGAYVIDATTGEVLYSKAPSEPRAIASITKIFTVLVILRDHSLSETVTVPRLPAYTNGAVAMGLVPGQKFKLSELVKAALIPSANDAADTLAIYDSGSVKAFTNKMNQLVESWDISGAKFASASGLDDTNNHASPEALAKAARLLLANPEIKAMTSTNTTTISDLAGKQYNLQSTNQLLMEPGFSGIKTGYTVVAGQCLVARATINGHDVISVVLGSTDRFGETRRLIQAVSENYQWQKPPS